MPRLANIWSLRLQSWSANISADRPPPCNLLASARSLTQHFSQQELPPLLWSQGSNEPHGQHSWISLLSLCSSVAIRKKKTFPTPMLGKVPTKLHFCFFPKAVKSWAQQTCIARANKDAYTSQLTAFLGTHIHRPIHHSKSSFPRPYPPAPWAAGLLTPFLHTDRTGFACWFLFWVGPSKGGKDSITASVKLRLLPDR